MYQRLLFGGVTILAAVLPLWLAMGLFLGFGMNLGHWLLIACVVSGLCALVAGILMFSGHPARYTAGVVAWVFLVAWTLLYLALTWPTSWWSYETEGAFAFSVGTLAVQVIY